MHIYTQRYEDTKEPRRIGDYRTITRKYSSPTLWAACDIDPKNTHNRSEPKPQAVREGDDILPIGSKRKHVINEVNSGFRGSFGST